MFEGFCLSVDNEHDGAFGSSNGGQTMEKSRLKELTGERENGEAFWKTYRGGLDYEWKQQEWNKIIRSTVGDWYRNLDTIVEWSPYSSEADLLCQSYASILNLRLPSNFRIILRGKDVEHHNIVNDMMLTETVTYRPNPSAEGAPKDLNLSALVIIGFVKNAKHHIDVQGFNVYHKNRLIKPFWRVWNSTGSEGRGVIGVLEANFVEPAHDKQGFERTTVLARLEARLVQMQKNYWYTNCHRIGYAPRRDKKIINQTLAKAPRGCSDDYSFLGKSPSLFFFAGCWFWLLFVVVVAVLVVACFRWLFGDGFIAFTGVLLRSVQKGLFGLMDGPKVLITSCTEGLTDDPKVLKTSCTEGLTDDLKVLKTSYTEGLTDNPKVLITSCTEGLTDDPKVLKTSCTEGFLKTSCTKGLTDDPKVLKTSCTEGLTDDPKVLKISKSS
ncbi:MORC family CW-type zinc finger protein 4, putative isoform 3 [Hibiscus syriacus]|uniref:MORC family CW-type zinc finger protein 4, putative isoform 3 n=1 Tax=Hibiscus syriacus TaxID=106335 RepID=A0A6A2Y448_HIBSY|nr:MORC family CW-type zinc finger protein 4, putative isoform 3 [Hibiscus syriacus]